jgi:hypothetical protein
MIVDFSLDMTLLEDDFFDDIDEIMEDTMINIFILHPKTLQEIQKAKDFSQEHHVIFYTLPLEFLDEHRDENCKALYLDAPITASKLDAIDLPICISAEVIDDSFASTLATSSTKGVILDADKNYHIPNFFEGMSYKTLLSFSDKELEAIDMKHIVLHSNYPNQGFETIHETAKLISDAIFRPDESIKNCATVNSLSLLGLR